METYIYDVHIRTPSITVIFVSQLEHKDSQHGKCWTLSLEKTSETFRGFAVWKEIPYILPETLFSQKDFPFLFPRNSMEVTVSYSGNRSKSLWMVFGNYVDFWTYEQFFFKN